MPEIKEKQKLSFTTIVSKTHEIPEPVINSKNDGFLTWGQDNKYPCYLYNLYEHSSQMSSIIKNMIDYLTGDKIINNTKLQVSVNRKGETMNDLIENLAFDYCVYGGLAFQVIRDRNGDIAELNYIDFRTVRTNEDEDKVYVNNGWKYNVAKRGVQTKVYERFNPKAKQPNSVYYYKGHLSKEVYPVPMYIGAITSLEISTQIPNFHLHNITNNFSPNVIINFNSGSNLPEDVMAEAEEKINHKFVGTDNAGNIMLSFNDDSEHATTIERLQDDNYDKKYETLKESVSNDIYSAFRINHTLVGINHSTGFNTQEFSQCFELYNKTVIKPMQEDIIGCFEKVFGKGCIEIEQFHIEWADETTENSTPVDGEIVSSNE
ncbi:MAG: phage portal protein [Alphaproteobacteria bacterium]|nr:phage portal protein [Alphaproteobacteria bacterium]